MKYVVSLEHADFVLLMEVLKKARQSGIVTWSPCNLVCRNTKVEFDEMEG